MTALRVLTLFLPLAVGSAHSAHSAARAADTSAAELEFFEKRVRPILAEHCHKCHAAREKKPKGGLLLDSRPALLKGGDNGPALVPGDPAKSRLIQAINYQDTALLMPPKGKLPDAAIADLTTWVKKGAPWPADKAAGDLVAKDEFDLYQRKRAHWAWQPVRAASPPAVQDASWPLGPADRFVLAKLEAKGLKPAPLADGPTLLRRLYFDLIGLPPDVGRIFNPSGRIENPSYEAVVDRLLASPHFGERWGRHWLDLVRYAETRGHEFDPPLPNAHQYRDYVIRALNADVPYDQFVREHVAGDLLEKPRLHPAEGFDESILGTGFWFLGEEVHSPVDIRADQADRYDNRIDVLTKTFLGLTVACARCHDHKFDAISTKDYYALFGFLESGSYRLVRFDALEHNRAVAAQLWKARAAHQLVVSRALTRAAAADRLPAYLLAAHANGVHDLDPIRLGHWRTALEKAATDPRNPLHLWTKVAADPDAGDPKRFAELLHPFADALKKQEAERATVLRDIAIVIDYSRCDAADWLPDDFGFGPAPWRAGEARIFGDAKQPVLRFAEQSAAVFDRVWDGMKSASGSENDPGALGKQDRAGRTIRTPTFTITSGKVHYLVRGAGLAYAAVNAHTMIQGPLHSQLVQSVKAGDAFRWVTHDLSAYQGHRAHVEFSAAEDADFAVAMVVQGECPPAVPPPSRRAVRAESLEALAREYQKLFLDLAKQPPEEYARLADWLVRHSELSGDAAKELTDAARAWHAEEQRIAATIRRESRLAMALRDGTGVDEHVFIRGAHKALGERVPRRFLEALTGPTPLVVSRASGRLELAHQMTDPATTPLIARVLVNRVWHHLFGRGLVASVDNFGVMGDAPTHPELLDYLADQFVRDGWSIKKLIRTLVLSRTYQMASQAADPAAEQADSDNLLLHRMRLRRLQGEAIRDALLAVSGRLDRTPFGPPVPTYLTPFLEGRGRPGASGPLDGDGRRSVYQAVRRNFLAPLMLAFDTPSPFSTMGRRTVSNVPAQALILMNDPFVHQQAELWGKRVAAQPGSVRERITGMYLSAFARPPTEQELSACLEFLDRQVQLGSVGGKRQPSLDSDPGVWKDLAHALFNVKEFIFLK